MSDEDFYYTLNRYANLSLKHRVQTNSTALTSIYIVLPPGVADIESIMEFIRECHKRKINAEVRVERI